MRLSMARRLKLIGLSFGTAFASLTATSHAALIDYFFVAEQASYSVQPGDGIAVPIYLEERTNGEASLLAGELGLSQAGFGVTQSILTSPADAATITGVSASGAFDTPIDVSFSDVHNSAAVWLVHSSISEGVPATTVSPGVNRVLIGTLTLEAGQIAGDETTFEVGSYDPQGSGYTFTFSSLHNVEYNASPGDLYINAAPTTFSVTVLPEPSAMLGIGCAWVLCVNRRRRGNRD